MIKLISPTKIGIYNSENQYEELKKLLTFTDTSVQYQIKRFKHAHWFVNKYGEEAYQERLQELKDSQKVCLLEDHGDHYETYSGLLTDLAHHFNQMHVPVEFEYPSWNPIPWYNEPANPPRDYQKEAVERLLHAKHGNIALPTGSGKSYVILLLAKTIGLKTVVMAPSVSIARQLYEDFKHHLGTRYVGLYGDGKKEFKKRVVIAISKSLVNIEEDTEVWEHLSEAKVFIADESHLTPAETLKKVCFGVLGQAPYRFFVSATQMRNDGAELLLKAIIGPRVLVKEAKELIDSGFLAKPNFFIVPVESSSSYASADPLKMLHHHFYTNRFMHEKAAKMANRLVKECNHNVLIMIDHIEQFQYIYNHLQYDFGFAHGGVNKNNRDVVPEVYWKSDPNALVKRFNENNLKMLVGTGCISIGTDIRPVDSIINLQAGKSEIKFLQLIGRGTRRTPTKSEFNFFDYGIINIPSLKNHVLSRIEVYKEFYDNIKWLK
jgi:superfamily II DNA or RNA helicase